MAFVTLVMAALLSGPPALAQDKPVHPATSLANQINNPALPVTLFQFRDVLMPSVAGTNDVTNVLELQPVFPIHPSRRTPFLQLIKITMPIAAALPAPVRASGMGDLQFFDLVSIKAGWGRWGFGPALVFPTATADSLGAGKWQAGPAAAVVYTAIDNLQLGAIFENPMSFAGNSSRPAVNNLIITPVVTYNFPGYFIPGYWQHGWFAGLTDYEVTFNWEDGGAATIPLGVQIGRVFHVGKQPYSLSFEAGGTVKSPASLPDAGLIIGIEFGIIFKGHHPDK